MPEHALHLKKPHALLELSLPSTLFITVYSKPVCTACSATYRALTKKGLHHETTDATADEDAYSFISGLGAQEFPVVTLTDEDGRLHGFWTGYRPDHITDLALITAAQQSIEEN